MAAELIELLKWVLVWPVSETVLQTNEKPTRPPPRKYNLTTKPPATSSQRRPTTATASVSTVATAAKPKAKRPPAKATKTNKAKSWNKSKKLNKKDKKVEPKNTLSKKAQPKKPAGIKLVGDKVKPKTNQTFTENLNSKTQTNSLRDGIGLKGKNLQRNGAQKETEQKEKLSKTEHVTFLNKTKLSVKTKNNKINIVG